MFIPLAANSPLNDQTMWWLVAIGGTVAIYLMMRPKGKRPDALAGGPKFSLSRQRDVENQMQNLLVELSAMARQITAQLDTRAARLELLIKEADEKLAELRTGLGGEINVTPLPPVVANDPDPLGDAVYEAPSAVEEQAQPVEHRHAEVYRLSDEGLGANEIARAVNRPTGEVELILAIRPK